MATLQRSTAFRRQGSSGVVWEDKNFLKEDKVDYEDLRPCQSTRVVGMTDPSSSKAAPTAFPRSYSTAPMNQSSKTRVVGMADPSNLKAAPTAFPRSYSTAPMNQSSKIRVIGMTDPSNSKAAPAAFPRSYSTAPMNQSSKAFGKPLGIPKSKSIKRKLLSNLLFSNK